MRHFSRRGRACTGFALLLAVGAAQAQTYPNKPVRLVVPWPTGGANDILGRELAEHMGRALGQQVVVDNRGGANGMIGAEAVARAAPDGYTVMFHNLTAHATNPAIYRKLSYDTVNDFAPVTQVASNPLIIVTHPSLPARDLRELIALARAQPGKLSYASFGNGSMAHLGGEMFKSMARINMLHVPYKGGGPALVDTLAGHVPVYFSGVATVVQHVQAGRLRGLAMTGSSRLKVLPDVPTVAEASDLKGYEASVTYGVWVPAKTPPEIIAKLNSVIVREIKTPEFRARLEKEGASEPIGNTPAEMQATLKAEMDKYAKVVKTAGIEPQ